VRRRLHALEDLVRAQAAPRYIRTGWPDSECAMLRIRREKSVAREARARGAVSLRLVVRELVRAPGR